MPAIRPLLGISACALITACGMAPYIEPDGPDVAILQIENGGADSLEAATYVGAESCSGMRRLHANIREHGVHLVKIPAGRPFTLWTKTERPVSSRGEAVGRIAFVAYCAGAMTFTPLPGRRYLVRFQMFSANNEYERHSGFCFARLSEEFRAADGTPRSRTLKYSWRKEDACR